MKHPLTRRVLWAIPLLGWAYVIAGLFLPLTGVWSFIWYVDVFLSVVVHGAQLLVSLPLGRSAGYSTLETVTRTMVWGAVWWRQLPRRALSNGESAR